MGFLIQLSEEIDHKVVALNGEVASCLRQHLVFDKAELDEVFAIGGILLGVAVFSEGLLCGVVDAGTNAPCEVEGACNADGADTIQLVRVENHLRLQCLWEKLRLACTKTVRSNAVGHMGYEGVILDPQL